MLRAFKQLEHLNPNSSQLKCVNELNQLQMQLLQAPSRQASVKEIVSKLEGAYIWGTVGSGKSLIMDLFHHTLNQESRWGLTSKRFHVHDLMRWIHSDLYRLRSRNEKGDLLFLMGQELVEKNQIICVDELFVKDIGEAMLLKGLFNGIWKSGGLLVATSNRHPSKLYENGLNRSLFIPFLNQLEKKCQILNLSLESDYRTLKGPSKKKCFFTNEQKHAFLADFLSKSSSPANIKIEIPNMDRFITVYGGNLIDRETKSHGSKNLVVLSSFEDLCKGYKSVNDYRAVMEKTALLYLDGIESIPGNELNDARRFVQLIDVAYEHKTRVVLRGTKDCLNIHDILKLVATGQDEKSVSEVIESQIVGKGGSSSSSATTYIGDMEWSATGLLKASLARGGNTDTRFAVSRTVSRLAEMHSADWDSEYD